MSLELKDSEVNSVLEEKGITVIDFWAPWCGPCKMYGPIIEQFAKDNPDIHVHKMNVDENSETATKHGIRSIPTTVLFKDGQVVTKVPGVIKKERLDTFIENLR
jgi:thioredoxin 1